MAGEALAELVDNQGYSTTYTYVAAVLFQYFHDGFFPADAESHLMLTHRAGPILDLISSYRTLHILILIKNVPFFFKTH